jgi:plasmid replication initiation protein
VTDTHDPWGPYRATVEDHLDTCADYLDRLRRSLAGEIAPDRHYFADKAHQLHTSARRMVRIVQDIDAWLGECTARIEHTYTDGTRLVADCALPGGHDGAHVDLDGRLPGRQVTGELRDLADAVERVSQSFGSAAPSVDCDMTGAAGTTTSAGALANLAASLDTIQHRTTRLAADVRIAEASAAGPAPDTGLPDGHRTVGDGSPSVGL